MEFAQKYGGIGLCVSGGVSGESLNQPSRYPVSQISIVCNLFPREVFVEEPYWLACATFTTIAKD